MKKKSFDNKEDFIAAGVDVIIQFCNNTQPHAFVALSGGTTPLSIYRALGEDKSFVADAVDFFLVDERNVGLDSEDSNYRAIMDQLGRDRGIRIHFFDTRRGVEGAIAEYGRVLSVVPKGTFDLVVLGMGTDGHIASLFPHTGALRSTAQVEHTTTDAFPVHDRMTMALPFIMRAKKILLLVGPNKKDMLEKAIYGLDTVEDIPAKKLMEHPDIMIHMLEKE